MQFQIQKLYSNNELHLNSSPNEKSCSNQHIFGAYKKHILESLQV